jgi:hypothetical protein
MRRMSLRAIRPTNREDFSADAADVAMRHPPYES